VEHVALQEELNRLAKRVADSEAPHGALRAWAKGAPLDRESLDVIVEGHKERKGTR
jgi:hypothetical protein